MILQFKSVDLLFLHPDFVCADISVCFATRNLSALEAESAVCTVARLFPPHLDEIDSQESVFAMSTLKIKRVPAVHSTRFKIFCSVNAVSRSGCGPLTISTGDVPRPSSFSMLAASPPARGGFCCDLYLLPDSFLLS